MKTDIYNGYKVNLIESIEELDAVLKTFNPKVLCGGDTETQGLDYNYHRMVGFCMSGGKSYSKEDYAGSYIPVRHNTGNNLPLDEVLKRIQYFIDNFKTCWWNRTFDMSMLELDGIKVPFVGKMHDAQIMAHLAFSESFPALKEYSKNLLKFDVIEFSSNNAKDHNFGTTDPNISFRYAAQDPIITVLLGQKLWNDYPYIRTIYPLDNKVSEAVRHFCNTTVIPLNHDILNEELDVVNQKIAEVQRKIFSITGYSFKLNSTADKSDALSRFVTLTTKTKTGKFATDKEALSKIDHPLAKLLLEYNELRTYRDSFVAKMCTYPKEGIHINYSTCNTVTGRMSSGSSSGNTFFAPQNIQNIPKVQKSRYVHLDEDMGYSLNDEANGFIPKELTEEQSTDSKNVFTITCDDKTYKFVEGTFVKINRNGKIIFVKVENLIEGDELLTE